MLEQENNAQEARKKAIKGVENSCMRAHHTSTKLSEKLKQLRGSNSHMLYTGESMPSTYQMRIARARIQQETHGTVKARVVSSTPHFTLRPFACTFQGLQCLQQTSGRVAHTVARTLEILGKKKNPARCLKVVFFKVLRYVDQGTAASYPDTADRAGLTWHSNHLRSIQSPGFDLHSGSAHAEAIVIVLLGPQRFPDATVISSRYTIPVSDFNAPCTHLHPEEGRVQDGKELGLKNKGGSCSAKGKGTVGAESPSTRGVCVSTSLAFCSPFSQSALVCTWSEMVVSGACYPTAVDCASAVRHCQQQCHCMHHHYSCSSIVVTSSIKCATQSCSDLPKPSSSASHCVLAPLKSEVAWLPRQRYTLFQPARNSSSVQNRGCIKLARGRELAFDEDDVTDIDITHHSEDEQPILFCDGLTGFS
ncbi:hypothetical protein B566_EDAN013315 [Ephemera danica]|nr:hypothetical protein B566_EDAN013315 [Ephemera danica]